MIISGHSLLGFIYRKLMIRSSCKGLNTSAHRCFKDFNRDRFRDDVVGSGLPTRLV